MMRCVKENHTAVMMTLHYLESGSIQIALQVVSQVTTDDYGNFVLKVFIIPITVSISVAAFYILVIRLFSEMCK